MCASGFEDMRVNAPRPRAVERREHERWECEIPSSICSVGGGQHPAILLDISAGGARVAVLQQPSRRCGDPVQSHVVDADSLARGTCMLTIGGRTGEPMRARLFATPVSERRESRGALVCVVLSLRFHTPLSGDVLSSIRS